MISKISARKKEDKSLRLS